MRTKIVFSEKCLDYGAMHVEGPRRVRIAHESLRKNGYVILTPDPASEKDILEVHDSGYVRGLREGSVADADTPPYEDIYEISRLAAGGAVLAAEVGGFSLMRPPGHHAGKRGRALGAMTRGFCYLNNVAIAVRHLRKPALILDIDGHHGNGTQEIFQGDPDVIYVGLHRYPLYPGPGVTSENNCLNYPLRADCGEEAYLKTLDEALSKVELDRIEVVAISAGFDTHAGDLASLGLTEKSFTRIGSKIASLQKHTFFVLEGGYSGENNGNDIDALLKGFELQPRQ